MKLQLTIVFGFLFAAVSLQADIANYDATIESQSSGTELYQFNFDNSLSAAVGSGTFTAGANTAYTTDLSGNANDALSVTANATSGGYTMANNAFVAGQGTTTSSGTLSFLFNISTTSSSEYFLSIGGDVTSDNNALALDISGGTPQMKIGNHSTSIGSLTTGVWYYFAVTWSFDGVAADDTSTFYIGKVGGSLNSLTGASGGSYTAASAVGGTTGETGSSGNIVVGNRQANNTGMLGDYGTLATWSSQLTSSQIDAQYAALTTTAVPEPSTIAMIGTGVLMLFGLRRRIA
jgi:hypothetical protein